MKFAHFLPLALTGPVLAQSSDLVPQQIDEMVVTSSPLRKTLFELAQPATILADEELQERLQGTLGDTLNGHNRGSARRPSARARAGR